MHTTPPIPADGTELVDKLIGLCSLTNKSFVVQLGSGDGSFLKLFKAKSIPCMGFEADSELASVATKKNVDTVNSNLDVQQAWDFLSESHTISRGKKADVVIFRFGLFQFDDLNELLEAVALILREDGLMLLEEKDKLKSDDVTSYSTQELNVVLQNHDLEIVDILRVPDSGSLRFFIRHKEMYSVSPAVTEFIGQQVQEGI